MGSIEVTIETDIELTTFTVIGDITAADLIATLHNTYSTAATSLALWDFTEADGSQITGDQLKGIAHAMKAVNPDRKNAQTALVYSRSFGFGMGRMYETMAESERIPVSIRIFYDLEEARRWLLAT